MASCGNDTKHEYTIQKEDRLLKFGHNGAVLVTDKCVVVIRDSANYNSNSCVIMKSIATRVYIFPENNKTEIDTITLKK